MLPENYKFTTGNLLFFLNTKSHTDTMREVSDSYRRFCIADLPNCIKTSSTNSLQHTCNKFYFINTNQVCIASFCLHNRRTTQVPIPERLSYFKSNWQTRTKWRTSFPRQTWRGSASSRRWVTFPLVTSTNHKMEVGVHLYDIMYKFTISVCPRRWELLHLYGCLPPHKNCNTLKGGKTFLCTIMSLTSPPSWKTTF